MDTTRELESIQSTLATRLLHTVTVVGVPTVQRYTHLFFMKKAICVLSNHSHCPQSQKASCHQRRSDLTSASWPLVPVCSVCVNMDIKTQIYTTENKLRMRLAW